MITVEQLKSLMGKYIFIHQCYSPSEVHLGVAAELAPTITYNELVLLKDLDTGVFNAMIPCLGDRLRELFVSFENTITLLPHIAITSRKTLLKVLADRLALWLTPSYYDHFEVAFTQNMHERNAQYAMNDISYIVASTVTTYDQCLEKLSIWKTHARFQGMLLYNFRLLIHDGVKNGHDLLQLLSTLSSNLYTKVFRSLAHLLTSKELFLASLKFKSNGSRDFSRVPFATFISSLSELGEIVAPLTSEYERQVIYSELNPETLQCTAEAFNAFTTPKHADKFAACRRDVISRLQQLKSDLYCKPTSDIVVQQDRKLLITEIKQLIEQLRNPQITYQADVSMLEIFCESELYQVFREELKEVLRECVRMTWSHYQTYNNVQSFNKKTYLSDFHNHLNGSLSDDFLKITAQKNKCPDLYDALILLKKEYIDKTQQQPEEGYSPELLKLVWQQFALIHQIIQTPSDITIGTLDVVRHSKAKYIEIRTTPKAMGHHTREDYIKAFEFGLQQANNESSRKKTYGLLSLDRSIHTLKDAEAFIERIFVNSRTTLVGLDISGNPSGKRTLTGDDLGLVVARALKKV